MAATQIESTKLTNVDELVSFGLVRTPANTVSTNYLIDNTRDLESTNVLAALRAQIAQREFTLHIRLEITVEDLTTRSPFLKLIRTEILSKKIPLLFVLYDPYFPRGYTEYPSQDLEVLVNWARARHWKS